MPSIANGLLTPRAPQSRPGMCPAPSLAGCACRECLRRRRRPQRRSAPAPCRSAPAPLRSCRSCRYRRSCRPRRKAFPWPRLRRRYPPRRRTSSARGRSDRHGGRALRPFTARPSRRTASAPSARRLLRELQVFPWCEPPPRACSKASWALRAPRPRGGLCVMCVARACAPRRALLSRRY